MRGPLQTVTHFEKQLRAVYADDELEHAFASDEYSGKAAAAKHDPSHPQQQQCQRGPDQLR